ncbi:unnamed protein product [Linum trigynum]|uniref:Uncharacterized protein n=1 Tax=Linum trigynum TaxID=586398 RepID=A0AAV2DYV8_9ROSI
MEDPQCRPLMESVGFKIVIKGDIYRNWAAKRSRVMVKEKRSNLTLDFISFFGSVLVCGGGCGKGAIIPSRIHPSVSISTCSSVDR